MIRWTAAVGLAWLNGFTMHWALTRKVSLLPVLIGLASLGIFVADEYARSWSPKTRVSMHKTGERP